MLLAASAPAQFVGTYSSGTLGRALGSTEEAVDEGLEKARWRLGPFRLAPWVELSDLSYTDNAYGTAGGTVSDVSARLTLGLHAYVPFGEKVVLGLVALPSTSYWAELDQFRGWTYLYGAGLFVYLNRLTLEIQATDAETQQQVVVPGLGRPVDGQSRSFSAQGELKLLGRVSFFASGSFAQLSYNAVQADEIPDLPYVYLDRDERFSRAGFRYRWNPRVAVGVGMMSSDITYHEAVGRSNSGDGGMVDVQLGFGPTSLSLSYANMRISPEGSSESLDYDGMLGKTELRYEGGAGWNAALYVGRRLSFGYALSSLTEDYRYGLNVSFPVGWRLRLGGYAEQGTVTYVGVPGLSTDRQEDLTAYQVSASIRLGAWTLRTSLSRDQYTDALTLSERQANRLSFSLSPPGAFRGWW